jgi:lactoylglutathione lyase
MKIDHVRLLVVNFAECFHFYRDVVGLTVLWGNEADSYASFVDQAGENPNIALFKREAMADAIGTSHLPVEVPCQDRTLLIIGVDDVDAEYKRMQVLGVTLVVEPRNYPGWGMRSAYVRDPDGNLIELTGKLPPEEWTQGLRDAAEEYKQAGS